MKLKEYIIYASIAVAFLIGAICFQSVDFYLSLAFYISSLLIIGHEVYIKSFKNIIRGKIFDENFLMFIATLGAFCLGEFLEGVAVLLLFETGEMLQGLAVNKSRRSIRALLDLRPDKANVLRDGVLLVEHPRKVKVGELIQINPHEKIPLDACVVSGVSVVDMSSITGESIPVSVQKGDNLCSGTINLSGALTASVTQTYSNSTASKIIELVEDATERKSKSERFITKFAKYYTPIVFLLALGIAILPPLLFSLPFADWIYRALVFLVISCPCALVISVPLSFFGGIGGASKNGVLIKGSSSLDNIAGVDTVIFDKTGTLTQGKFKMAKIITNSFNEKELLEIAASLESYSHHPIAFAITEAFKGKIDKSKISNVNEKAGFGIHAKIDGQDVLVGSEKFLLENKIKFEKVNEAGSVVYVARDGKYLGAIVVADTIKPNAQSAIASLKELGVQKTIMLSGDNYINANAIGKELGLNEIYAQLLPEDKLQKISEIIQAKNGHGNVAYVGDGINDAPSLARADVGIAMGGLGADAAIESADVVIMNDDLQKIGYSIKKSRQTIGIAKQNIFFSLFIKIAVLALGAVGIATMWSAVFADVGVTILAIANAMRALKNPK